MKKVKTLIGVIIAIFLITASISWSADSQRQHFKRGRSKKKARTVVNYQIPEVKLLNQNGDTINLKNFLDSDKIVVLDFIYTTCPTICPILSAGMANFQKKMAGKADSIRLVSFTIDPEYDRPENLKEYAERYGAQDGWTFLTGSRRDIDSVMRALDAYVPDKMSHKPLTFLHGPGQKQWVRVNALMSTAELIEEYQKLTN